MSQQVQIRVPHHLLSANGSCGHSITDPVGSILPLQTIVGIPDVLSRSGRKLIYKDIDNFCDQLLGFCVVADSHKTGSVAMTLLQMAEDSVLQRELVMRASLLKNFWRKFLDPALCPFTLLIGIRFAIAMLSIEIDVPDLHGPLYTQLRAIAGDLLPAEHPSALPVLCARALLKCIPTTNAGDLPSRRLAASRIIALLDLPAKMSRALFVEFVGRVTSVCRQVVSFDEDFSAPIRRFLIGTACSADPVSRKRAVSCLMRLSTADKIGSTSNALHEVSPPVWDATVFTANYSRARRELGDRAEDGLPMACRRLSYFMSQTASMILQCRQTGDPIQLGLSLCEVIVDDPLAVCFENACSERFGFGKNVPPRQFRLPCDAWRDVLTFAARVIKMLPEYQHLSLPLSSEIVTVQHVVDVLTIHHAFLCGNLQEAAKLSRVAAARVHDDVFFRYGATLDLKSSVEIDDAAQFLKEIVRLNGEDIRQRTLYQMMLRNLAVSAFFSAIEFWDVDDAGASGAWPIICKSMNLAYDLAFEYVTYAPQAARDLPTMMAVHFLSAFIIFGDTQPPPPDFKRLSQSYEAALADSDRFFGDLRRHKKLSAMMDLFLRHGAAALAQWGPILHAKRGARDVSDPLGTFRAGDSAIRAPWWRSEDEAVWADLRRVHDGDQHLDWSVVPGTLVDTLLVPRFREMHLQECAYCGTESSLVRKCAACRDVRYCSKQCQKLDWNLTHRERCTGAFRDSKA